MTDGAFRGSVCVPLSAAPCLNFPRPLYKASAVLSFTLTQACLPMLELLPTLKISLIRGQAPRYEIVCCKYQTTATESIKVSIMFAWDELEGRKIYN